MAKSLLIVESPAKARTLKGYLGEDFQVEASVGHVKDLPKSELGVDVDHDFAPQYGVIRGKGKVLQQLKKAAQEADVVYLAPDPDREGEAIAWHIADEICPRKGKDKKPVYRVMIHEITKKGIKEALEHPGVLNEDRYNAQQARRILDRLVGYQISPILWDKVRRGLSAGRVQSVALRLVVDRERAIQAFSPQEYWTLDARLEGRSPPPFGAGLRRIGGKPAELKTGEEAAAARVAAQAQPFRLAKVERKEKRRNPAPPFITSSLQRDAFRKHRFSAKKTMMLAQRLYEGVDVEGEPVGLITYMRTDSPRLSADAVTACREHILRTYGDAYVPAKAVEYKAKKGAQEAHEAVRPTSLEHTPERVRPFLDPDQYRLYKLVWDRFVACQMMPAVYDQTTFDVEAGAYLFRAVGSILKFKGFTAVYVEGLDEPEEEASDEDRTLPDLGEGEVLRLLELAADQHFTQPPARFTESTLVKELEDKEIGRPSTYAQILSTLRDKGYVKMVDKRFAPTDLGTLVTELLVDNFPDILDVGFTAQMEAELDHVEEGRREWHDLLRGFYGPFSQTLERAGREMVNMKAREEPTDVACERCGQPMVIRWGRNGFFLACSGYPSCKTTKEFQRHPDGTIEIVEGESMGEACPQCQSDLLIKKGRFGRFVACSRYPDCKYTRPVGTGVSCPRQGCSGELVEKRSKAGRTFYACNRYPDCDQALWDRPIPRECPDCGNPYLVEKYTKQGTVIRCPKRGCGYKEEAEG